MFAALSSDELRVYLSGQLCLPEMDAPLRLTFCMDHPQCWKTHAIRKPRYMVEPGEASDCWDYEVPGASKCETERQALELWCSYFWTGREAIQRIGLL